MPYVHMPLGYPGPHATVSGALARKLVLREEGACALDGGVSVDGRGVRRVRVLLSRGELRGYFTSRKGAESFRAWAARHCRPAVNI